MKVLIVDDDAINRKVWRAVLGAVESKDGLTALQTLQHEKIDAVISDILMPRMDGYRLRYEIRKTQSLRLPR